MKLSRSLVWLAVCTASATTPTDFSKEKAGIDAIAEEAEANLFTRLCQHESGPQNPPGDDGLNSSWLPGKSLGSSKTTCTADELVYRKE
jgi:hypothetical protein